MDIILNDKRQTYRLSIPVVFSYHLIGDNEFELAQQMVQEGKSFFEQSHGEEIKAVTEQIRKVMSQEAATKQQSTSQQASPDITVTAAKQGENSELKEPSLAVEDTEAQLDLLSKRLAVLSGFEHLTFADKYTEAVDLSLGGMAFHGNKQLNSPAKIVVEIQLTEAQKPLYVFGEVCGSALDAKKHQNQDAEKKLIYLIRVQFRFFNAEGQQILAKFLEQKLLEQS